MVHLYRVQRMMAVLFRNLGKRPLMLTQKTVLRGQLAPAGAPWKRSFACVHGWRCMPRTLASLAQSYWVRYLSVCSSSTKCPTTRAGYTSPGRRPSLRRRPRRGPPASLSFQAQVSEPVPFCRKRMITMWRPLWEEQPRACVQDHRRRTCSKQSDPFGSIGHTSITSVTRSWSRRILVEKWHWHGPCCDPLFFEHLLGRACCGYQERGIAMPREGPQP